MKAIYLAIVTVFVVSACNNADSSAVADFIPGTYVANFHDSLSPTSNVTGIDTLVISKQAQQGSDTYQITRKTRFQRTLDNVSKGEESKTDTWIGFYDIEHKVIRTQTE